jgi:uncharacterized ion transporter superfamily protein YfcC
LKTRLRCGLEVFTDPVEVLSSSDGPLVAFVIFLSVFIGGIYYVLDKADVLKRIIAWIYRKFDKRRYAILCLWSLFSWCSALPSVSGRASSAYSACDPHVHLVRMGFAHRRRAMLSRRYARIRRSTLIPYGTALVQSIAGVPVYSGLCSGSSISSFPARPDRFVLLMQGVSNATR